MIPEFAIVGHLNEGKSAVVSTLAEDDSVRVTAYPGETVECGTFPVVFDREEIIRFKDTPGFRNPEKTLAWIENFRGADERMLKAYLETHAGYPDLKDNVDLLRSITKAAGIIYVVDGSRPVRKVDLIEMESLRLTGQPRMAIINCKGNETRHLKEWKREFLKTFNAFRVFNANKATYAERIELLENLKSIDQDLGPALAKVISAFKEDWQQRNDLTAEIICDLIENCLSYSITKNFTGNTDEAALRKDLREEYNRAIEKMEKEAHEKIRKLFRHNIFNCVLPAHSIPDDELPTEKTRQFPGLTPKQLIVAAGIAGGAIGAVLDLAASGLTFGVFTAMGGLVGAGWTALGGGKRLGGMKWAGLNPGGQQIKIGPAKNIQYTYVLLERALIFYSHIINWSHGRRDYLPEGAVYNGLTAEAGLTFECDDKSKEICQSFYTPVRNKDRHRKALSRKMLKEMLQGVFPELLKLTRINRKSD